VWHAVGVRFAAVQKLLDEAVGVVFPAAQSVVIDGGRVVWRGGAGACDERTVFDLASLTKPLSTVTLLLRQMAVGRISLDDEPRAGLSVRLMMAHASGLPAWRPFFERLSGREILEAARSEPLESKPGEVARYSDLNFMLLGDWLEQRTGRRQNDLFTDEIAAPLGLELGYLPKDAAHCAPTRDHRQGVVDDENCRAMGGVAGHAGLFGTAADVAALASALLDGQVVDAIWLQKAWAFAGVPAGSTWGLGWDHPSAENSSAGTRWPRDGVGHLGFTGTSLWLDPPRHRAVVLLTNRVNPTRDNERIKPFRGVFHDAVFDGLT
jgi:CubicO group peptidase (beta-lactamase class C family)